MHDEFLYIAKARPGPPLVTGSVRHASRAAGGAVKHLLHSHLVLSTATTVAPPAAGNVGLADPAEPLPVEVSKVDS